MKNILLAVTGLSPQVITETMYALHQNYQTLDEIHIITTRTGKEKIYSELIGRFTLFLLCRKKSAKRIRTIVLAARIALWRYPP